MSLQEFWASVRTGASYLAPKATVDSPKLDANRIEAILRHADIWLTPKSVAGYEEADFEFLSEEERYRLTACVDNFLEIAKQVPPDQPATQEQVEAALPAFRCLLEILRPDKYGDVEALEIGKRVEQRLAGQLPEWVNDLRFETGEDSNGDPAIWVWIEIADYAAQPDNFSQNTRQARELLQSCLRKLGVPRWPYVRFRTASEQAEAQPERAE